MPSANAESDEKLAALPVSPVRPAYEQVADQLRAFVIRGDLRPGHRLPSEAKLAALFGVGRTTAREALRLLASQGLVATKRGVTGGTFVIVPDRDAICRHLEANLGLLAGSDRPGIEELLEARSVLEVPAARLAAGRHTEAQLDALAGTVPDGLVVNENMEQAEFHMSLLRISGNQLLEVVTRPVFDVLRARLLRSAAPAGFWDRVVEYHCEILAAITRRDEEGAGEAMREHLVHLESVYRSIDTALHRDLVSTNGQTALLRANERED
jgi:DNA-binding FadR family transcriptional regulator